jgi:hypothetical protein
VPQRLGLRIQSLIPKPDLSPGSRHMLPLWSFAHLRSHLSTSIHLPVHCTVCTRRLQLKYRLYILCASRRNLIAGWLKDVRSFRGQILFASRNIRARQANNGDVTSLLMVAYIAYVLTGIAATRNIDWLVSTYQVRDHWKLKFIAGSSKHISCKGRSKLREWDLSLWLVTMDFSSSHMRLQRGLIFLFVVPISSLLKY